jgi:alpha-D-xyloside xylohydrolase
MTKTPGVNVVFSILLASTAWGASGPQFPIKGSQKDANGVTLHSVSGTMRMEACGDRIIHVVASPTSAIPNSKVPVVTQPCRASNVVVSVGKEGVKLSTAAVTVMVNARTGAVTFLSHDGKPVLAEPAAGGKFFDVPASAEMKTWQTQQTFVSPSDEAQYGLGQHQEGIFNVRGVPIRLHQANTNISIPFLLSSKGYGLLWNNPSLTDFNPADQAVAIDATTGKGKFTTGAKGSYGFLLASDNKDQLVLDVNGKHVIDLVNMWTPSSGSGVAELDANKEYEVSAKGGPGGVQLSARPPQDTTTFRSEMGPAIDYYFFYGPELNRVIADYRQLTGEAPLLPKWAYGYWQCRERYHTQKEILDVGGRVP